MFVNKGGSRRNLVKCFKLFFAERYIGMWQIKSLSTRLLLSCLSSNCIRSLNTTAHVCGRKSRNPYDRRFGIHLHDALPGKPGATKELYEELSRARMNIMFLLLSSSFFVILSVAVLWALPEIKTD